MKIGYRPEIDGLRTVAVAGVLLCHYKTPFLAGGFAGVDVFFVISGYLITQMIDAEINAGRFSLKTFYVRRARRLFPALFFTLLASFVAAAVILPPERMQDLSVSLIAAALSFSNLLFWSQQGYFDVASGLKPLLHTWSLGVEEQFYLFWPLSMLLFARWRVSARLALIVLFAASLGANQIWRDHGSSIFYLLPFRVFEFATGGLVVSIKRPRSNFLNEFCATAGLSMILISYFLFSAASHFPSLPALLPCFGAALIILSGSSRFSEVLLSNRFVVAIGKRSYSIYLAHWPIIVLYQYVVLTSVGWKTNIWLAAGTFVIASGMYSLVEQPFRQRKNGSPPALPTTFLPWAVGVTTALLLVSATAASSGWIWRLGDRATLYRQFEGSQGSIREAIYGGGTCGNQCDTNPGKPVSIYLIGDSNAQQYYFGFKTQFPAINVRIFQFSSCPFFSFEYTRDFDSISDPKLYDDGCRSVRHEAFRQIKSSNAFVIISQFWVNYPLISETTGLRVRAVNMEEAAKLVASQIAALKDDLGIRQLVIFGIIPGMAGAGNPIDCLGRPFPRYKCDASPIVTEPQASNAVTNALLTANLSDKATFLNPFDALCDGTECKMIAEEKPLYSDEHHLSKWGAEKVVGSFHQPLSELLDHASILSQQTNIRNE